MEFDVSAMKTLPFFSDPQAQVSGGWRGFSGSKLLRITEAWLI